MYSDLHTRTRLAIERLITILEDADFAPALNVSDLVGAPEPSALECEGGPSRPRALTVRSTRSDDPDLDFAIDVFLLRLGERVDACQDAEARGDVIGLLRCAGVLATHGEALGFPVLVRAAHEIRSACAESNPDTIRKSVEELSEIAQRIWRGYCSVF
jgi:hypothetical protein